MLINLNICMSHARCLRNHAVTCHSTKHMCRGGWRDFRYQNPFGLTLFTLNILKYQCGYMCKSFGEFRFGLV